jgi:hypothetical protein
MTHRCTIFALALALLACGCKKEIDVIGLNLQDEDILGAEFTEVPITAYSLLQDSINTKNLLNNVVGEIMDPVFGKTRAGFCTQFDVSGTNTLFPKQAVLDSVVLNLQYAGYFGDTLSGIRFNVQELSAPLDKEQYYDCDNQPDVMGGNLCYVNNYILPRPTTRVVHDTASTAPHLSLRLADNFGRKLLTLNKSDLATTTAFQNAFYGLCVQAEAHNNATGNLCYISLTSATSGITLYYTVDREHKKYTFPVSSNCTRYNFYTHDYTSASLDFRSQVINGNQDLGEETLYLQATAGVKTHVKTDSIVSAFAGRNVVINRAELVLTNISTDEEYFFQPFNLSLQVVSKDGLSTYYTPDDASYTSSNYFGGIYDEKTAEYRFRITNYVQQLLKGTEDGGLNIVVAGAGIRGNRLVFRGTDPDFADHFRLEVYYTEY